MTTVPEPLCVEWMVCYETRLRNTACIRSWAAPLGHATSLADAPEVNAPVVLGFWQEIDEEVLGLGKNTVHTTATLWCTGDLRPRHYRIASGAAVLSIAFQDDTFVVSTPQGELRSGSCEGADFLLANNMIAQLAVKTRLLCRWKRPEYHSAFFSPDTLCVIPYQLISDGIALRSSLGEMLYMNVDGWIDKVELPDQEFTIHRVELPVPVWEADSEIVHPANERELPEVGGRSVHISLSSVGNAKASLALPPPDEAARAAAVFLGGSGPFDRNGRSSGLDLGYDNLLFQLARHRLSSIRFDKPTCRIAGTSDALTQELTSLVAGGRAALGYLREYAETAGLPTFLIGHSLGGLAALALVAETVDVAGVVLLATPGRPFDQIAMEQVLNYARSLKLSAETTARWRERLANSFEVPTAAGGPKGLAEGALSLLRKAPAQVVSLLRCPMLILQGDNDIHLSTQDATLLAAEARPGDATIRIFRGLNHLFREASREEGLMSYYEPSSRFSAEVIVTIAEWILTRVP